MQFVFYKLPCNASFFVNYFRILVDREWLEIQVGIKCLRESLTLQDLSDKAIGGYNKAAG